MSESHVVAVSVAAAVALFGVFFLAWYSLRRIGVAAAAIAAIAPVLAGAAWFGVTSVARTRGWALSDEAQFHHLYVLGVVGMPLVGVVVGLVAWFKPAPTRATRRLAWVITLVFLVPAGAGIWATHIEPHWLRVDRIVLTDAVSGADRDQPLRIGVIADIQTDVFGDYEHETIDRLLAEAPDVILVAGDLTQVDAETYAQIRPGAVAALSRLEAPGGVFVIAGNTDVGGGDAIRSLAIDAGLTPLIDETIEVEVAGHALRIGGLAWPNNQRQGAKRFVQDFVASARPEVFDLLLAHSPDAVLHVPDADTDLNLVVSGHTHGGQIALPLIGPLWNVTDLPKSVAAGGLHTVRQTPIYVSTGVGVQRGESPKVRFGVRPSIAVITLKP